MYTISTLLKRRRARAAMLADLTNGIENQTNWITF